MGHCSRGCCLSTPGVLGSGSSYVVSIHHCLIRPHAPVPQARCDFAYRLYAAPSLCGSASATRGTFPTFTTVLSVHVADPTPAVRRAFPLYSHDDFRLPRTINRVATHDAVSASNTGRVISFRGCIVLLMLRPARLPCPPDWLRRDEVFCTSPRLLRYVVTPAFDAARCRTTLGVRLDGRTRNIPSSGLSPDQSQQLVRLHDSINKRPFSNATLKLWILLSPARREHRLLDRLPEAFRHPQTTTKAVSFAATTSCSLLP